MTKKTEGATDKGEKTQDKTGTAPEGGKQETTQEDGRPEFSDEQQKWVDEFAEKTRKKLTTTIEADIKTAFEKERDDEKAAADVQAQKDSDDAEAAKLKEQEEFEQLAGKHEKRVVELTDELKVSNDKLTVAEASLDKHATALATILEAQRKDLPEHILSLLDKQDPADQLTWIGENQEALTKKDEGKGRGLGSPANRAPATRKPTENSNSKASDKIIKGF